MALGGQRQRTAKCRAITLPVFVRLPQGIGRSETGTSQRRAGARVSCVAQSPPMEQAMKPLVQVERRASLLESCVVDTREPSPPPVPTAKEQARARESLLLLRELEGEP